MFRYESSGQTVKPHKYSSSSPVHSKNQRAPFWLCFVMYLSLHSSFTLIRRYALVSRNERFQHMLPRNRHKKKPIDRPSHFQLYFLPPAPPNHTLDTADDVRMFYFSCSFCFTPHRPKRCESTLWPCMAFRSRPKNPSPAASNRPLFPVPGPSERDQVRPHAICILKTLK